MQHRSKDLASIFLEVGDGILFLCYVVPDETKGIRARKPLYENIFQEIFRGSSLQFGTATVGTDGSRGGKRAEFMPF